MLFPDKFLGWYCRIKIKAGKKPQQYNTINLG